MVRRGIELEAKFAPAGEQTLADLAARTDFPGWWVTARRDETQQNTYFDTPDALLEANRCSLRRRVLGGGASGVEWTFKRGRGPGRDGVARRREVNALLPCGETDLPREKCAPVTRALRVVGAQPLLPLFALLTARRQIDLARDDGARVALALDRVQLEGAPEYRETEIEIELLDGDEHAVADLALWLMQTYGLLPMRGSKRGRALSWRRGEGLPVVAPALALKLLAERVRADAPAPTIALASPRGSGQATALAASLAALLPGARVVDTPPAAVTIEDGVGPLLLVGPEALLTAPGAIGVWVKVGLPRPLLARVIAAAAVGLDAWTILRRCGEYVVPSQRRFIDPAAQSAALVVIDNAPPATGPGLHDTPDVQLKLYGWPDEAALADAGATFLDTAVERDHFLCPPAPPDAAIVRVRCREDTAWVSLPSADAAPRIATYEARPRVLTLLHALGYTDAGLLTKERRRYRLDGWEIALDQIAGLGHFCEVRRLARSVTSNEGGEPGDDSSLRAIAARLGLGGARTTSATYRELWRETIATFAALSAAPTNAAGADATGVDAAETNGAGPSRPGDTPAA